jgi:hypothetical protein
MQFQDKLNPLHPRIKHISRSLNAIAHSFAQQAKTRRRVLPTCSCNNPTHSTSSCPVSVAINRLSLSGTMIVSVQCLRVMKLGCSAPYPCSKKKDVMHGWFIFLQVALYVTVFNSRFARRCFIVSASTTNHVRYDHFIRRWG